MPYVGQCGLVVQDDGDSTPFKVSFAGRPPCYFREEELEIAELEAEQVEFRAAVPFSLSEAGRKLHRHELRIDHSPNPNHKTNPKPNPNPDPNPNANQARATLRPEP